jgi:chondroitin 4-sulfotransferase 11
VDVGFSVPYSDSLRLIFIHIPKTAGTSIDLAFGLKCICCGTHAPWRDYRRRFAAKWASYFKFAIVRNPWERLVSSYCYARMTSSYYHDLKTSGKKHPDYDKLKDTSFADALRRHKSLRHPCWSSQSTWICDEKGNVMLDAVCRFERLEQDLTALAEAGKVPTTAIGHVNASDKGDWRRFYDDEAFQLALPLCRDDCARFGYPAEPWA